MLVQQLVMQEEIKPMKQAIRLYKKLFVVLKSCFVCRNSASSCSIYLVGPFLCNGFLNTI